MKPRTLTTAETSLGRLVSFCFVLYINYVHIEIVLCLNSEATVDGHSTSLQKCIGYNFLYEAWPKIKARPRLLHAMQSSTPRGSLFRLKGHFNYWGHITTEPGCSSGSLNNGQPYRDTVSQTQVMIPHPPHPWSQFTHTSQTCRCAIHWCGMSL